MSSRKFIIEQEEKPEVGGVDLTQPYEEGSETNPKPPVPKPKPDNGGGSTPRPRRKRGGMGWIAAPSCEEVKSGAKQMKKGMIGDCVGVVQKKLSEKGHPEVGTIDNKFGKNTETAVGNFQAKNSKTKTGIVDKETYDLLFGELVTPDPIQGKSVDGSTSLSGGVDVLPTNEQRYRKKYDTKRIFLVEEEETPSQKNISIMRRAEALKCLPGIWKERDKLTFSELKSEDVSPFRAFFVATSPDKKKYFFTSDFEIILGADPNKKTKWTCSGMQRSVGATENTQSLTVDQQERLNNIIAKQRSSRFAKKPEDYSPDIYTMVDLSQGDSKLGIPPASDVFTEKGKYFIYVKTGQSQAIGDNRKQVLDQLSGAGYTEMSCEDAEYNKDKYDEIKYLHSDYPKLFSTSFCMVKPIGPQQNQSEWNLYVKDNYAKVNSERLNPSKKTCKSIIKNYHNAWMKDLRVDNTNQLDAFKIAIQNCAKGDFRLNAGTKTMMNQILGSSKRDNERYGLNESNLSQLIRKNLLEIREQKKNFITETFIVKNRLSLLKESIGKSKNNRKLVFYSVVNEVINLKKQGVPDKIISEQFEEFFSALGGFFGSPGVKGAITGGIGGTFVEYAAEFIIKMLGLPVSSPVAQLFVTAVGNVGSFENIPRMLTECNFTAELLAKSVVESIGKNYVEQYLGNGFLADALRNILVDSAFNTDMVKTVTGAISGKVCELIGQLGDKAGDKAKEMKEKALS